MSSTTRTHSRTCVARMMIDAVENVRDAGEDLAAVNLYERALGYLDDSALCICKPLPRDHSHNVDGILVQCEALAHCPSVCDCPAGSCTATDAVRSRRSHPAGTGRAACWCEEPAAVLVTVDPYVTNPTHTVSTAGFVGEPAIAVCNQHAASMSGAVCSLDDANGVWPR